MTAAVADGSTAYEPIPADDPTQSYGEHSFPDGISVQSGPISGINTAVRASERALTQ